MKNYGKYLRSIFFGALAILVVFTSCKKDEEEPTTGILDGTITDGSTSSALQEVNIIIFSANTNSPVTTASTGEDGTFSATLDPGEYFIKVSKQGYLSVPAPGLTAVPFTIIAGETTTRDVIMFESSTTSAGFISGKVTDGSDPIAGALVVASDGTDAFSGVSDQDGNYIIFNVSAGSFTVKSWLSGYNSDEMNASVTVDTETPDINLTLTAGTSGTLSGQVTNLATENKDVDVALVHPITRETIPGLTGETSAQNYTLSNIPDGEYIARATFKNDARVMDPDRIFKFGEPMVTITSGSSEELNFDITNSVSLMSPTNELTSTVPLEITSTTPTFEWTPYSSTSDYVIEVTDATSGTIVWGGISETDTSLVKNIIIPSSETSITFNSDENATISELEVGKVYRWRIFASKNDKISPTGWTLISASEDQMGLIKVIE